jgi:hypothetical protein
MTGDWHTEGAGVGWGGLREGLPGLGTELSLSPPHPTLPLILQNEGQTAQGETGRGGRSGIYLYTFPRSHVGPSGGGLERVGTLPASALHLFVLFEIC